jgi:isoamylase
VVRMRERIKRNLLATLAFSQGVPMLSHGDEVSRTQLGNNNAYCQDSAISWVNWHLSPQSTELLEFTRKVFALRLQHPVLRRRTFFRHEPSNGIAGKDLTWLRPDGTEMTDANWSDESNHVLGMLIRGEVPEETDEQGRPLSGDSLLLLLNGGARSKQFALPVMDRSGKWIELLDTAHEAPRTIREDGVHLTAHSLILLSFQPVAP